MSAFCLGHATTPFSTLFQSLKAYRTPSLMLNEYLSRSILCMLKVTLHASLELMALLEQARESIVFSYQNM